MANKNKVTGQERGGVLRGEIPLAYKYSGKSETRENPTDRRGDKLVAFKVRLKIYPITG